MSRRKPSNSLPEETRAHVAKHGDGPVVYSYGYFAAGGDAPRPRFLQCPPPPYGCGRAGTVFGASTRCMCKGMSVRNKNMAVPPPST